VRVHLSAGRVWLAIRVRIGVELCKQLLDRQDAERQEKSLVTVITGSKITSAKRPCHRDLCYLFPISEDAELGFPGQDFLAAQQTGLTASKGKLIVLQNAALGDLCRCLVWS
jgi:hypothetical protein